MEIDEQTLIFRAEEGVVVEVAAMAGWGGRGFSDVGRERRGFPRTSAVFPRAIQTPFVSEMHSALRRKVMEVEF